MVANNQDLITSFFKSYARSFANFDSFAIINYYTYPCTIWHHHNYIFNQNDFFHNLTLLLEKYKKLGLKTAVFKVLAITIFCPYGSPEQRQFEYEDNTQYFDAIVRSLAAGEIRPLRSPVSARLPEQRVTLRAILNLAMKNNCEIAILYDTQGLEDSYGYSCSRICLYAGATRSTYASAKTNTTNTAAHISIPGNGRYKVIAHTHPTLQNYKEQLIQDVTKAGSDIEMVVNYSGRIFYYNKGGVLNKTSTTRFGNVYDAELKDEYNSSHTLSLDTAIDEGVIDRLNSIVPIVGPAQQVAEPDDGPDFLCWL